MDVQQLPEEGGGDIQAAEPQQRGRLRPGPHRSCGPETEITGRPAVCSEGTKERNDMTVFVHGELF